jgi:hypothetical protein
MCEPQCTCQAAKGLNALGHGPTHSYCRSRIHSTRHGHSIRAITACLPCVRTTSGAQAHCSNLTKNRNTCCNSIQPTTNNRPRCSHNAPVRQCASSNQEATEACCWHSSQFSRRGLAAARSIQAHVAATHAHAHNTTTASRHMLICSSKQFQHTRATPLSSTSMHACTTDPGMPCLIAPAHAGSCRTRTTPPKRTMGACVCGPQCSSPLRSCGAHNVCGCCSNCGSAPLCCC